jgi:hypothetical protein
MVFFGLVFYVVIAFGIAKLGEKRNIGFWGSFLLSFLLSPLIGLIFTLLSDEVTLTTRKYRCKFCGFTTSVNSDFCPACGKDDTGKDKDDYKQISNNSPQSD